MPRQDLDARAERAVRDMRKKEYKDTEAVAAFIRAKAQEERPIGDVNVDGTERTIDFKVLLKLLGAVGALVLVLSIAFAAPAAPKNPKREASFQCQRAAIAKNHGLVLPSATCECNARVGLPETVGCKALRTGPR